MRALARLSLGAYSSPAPELPPTAIRSAEQLDALRQVVEVARRLVAHVDARAVSDDDLRALGSALDWLDSVRLHVGPVEQPADAGALWCVADTCKLILPQLRALYLAAEAGDRAGVERWCSHASVSLGLLGAALRGLS